MYYYLSYLLEKFHGSFTIQIQEQGPKDQFPVLQSEISYRRSILILLKHKQQSLKNSTPSVNRADPFRHWPTSIYELCLRSLADTLSEFHGTLVPILVHMYWHLCGKRPVHRLILQHHVRELWRKSFLIRLFFVLEFPWKRSPNAPLPYFFWLWRKDLKDGQAIFAFSGVIQCWAAFCAWKRVIWMIILTFNLRSFRFLSEYNSSGG